jgi:hypothetical protein
MWLVSSAVISRLEWTRIRIVVSGASIFWIDVPGKYAPTI